MALLWLCAGVEASVHQATTTHAVCEEHGVLEDVGAWGESTDPHGHTATDRSSGVADRLAAAPASQSESHDTCDHLATVRDHVAIPPRPPAEALTPPPPPLDDERPMLASIDSGTPRGPPILSLAAKTSPPSRA
jgi:hypothetical protein